MTVWQWIALLISVGLTMLLEEIIRRVIGRRRKRSHPDFSHSFKKVEREVGKIRDKLNKMHLYPDVILGISGENLVGGTIFGALLASDRFLRMPHRFRQAFRDRELSDELKSEIIKNSWWDILIVDDESQSGDTIMQELTELEISIPEANIVVVTIVVRSESWHRFRSELWESPKKRCIYCYGNIPDEQDMRWPWKT